MIEVDLHQDLGRAKNAIQDFLIRKLLLPKIYLDSEWSGHRVDVLAVDRTGVGDLHVVELTSARPHFVAPAGGHELTMVSETKEIDGILERLKSIPGHFRYMAAVVPGSRSTNYYAGNKLLQAALAEDGVGRVGVLFVDLNGGEPSVKSIVKPERFRSAPEILKAADEFTASHTANWEVRE
jgi:hypothetical protein